MKRFLQPGTADQRDVSSQSLVPPARARSNPRTCVGGATEFRFFFDSGISLAEGCFASVFWISHVPALGAPDCSVLMRLRLYACSTALCTLACSMPMHSRTYSQTQLAHHVRGGGDGGDGRAGSDGGPQIIIHPLRSRNMCYFVIKMLLSKQGGGFPGAVAAAAAESATQHATLQILKGC